MEYDEANKVVRIPLAALQGPEGSRRTKLVMFTCNKCGEQGSRKGRGTEGSGGGGSGRVGSGLSGERCSQAQVH